MVVLEVKLGRKGGRKEFLRLERRVLSNGETSLRATLLGGGRFSFVSAPRSRGYLLLRIDLASREHRIR